MRIGVVCLPTDDWPRWRDRAQTLESLGFAHLWTYDHLSWRRYVDHPWHATVPLLAATAAVTSEIRLGTLVASPNFRHPVTLAKDAMTLDAVSGGRLTLGVGAGGSGFDATVLGGAAWSRGERTARFGEFVEVLDLLLRQRSTTYSGTYYSAVDARMIPGCVQQPRLPLAVAASGPRGLAVAARFGEAWITYGDPAATDPSPGEVLDAVARQSESLSTACQAIGRDPGSLARIMLLGNNSERVLSTVDYFSEVVDRYAAIGITDLIVHHPRADDPAWDDPPERLQEIAALLPALSAASPPPR